MKHVKLSCLFLLTIVLLNACKKENNVGELKATRFIGTYKSSNIAIVKKAEMYTKQGVITNFTTIRTFLMDLQSNSKISESTWERVESNLCNLTVNEKTASIGIMTYGFSSGLSKLQGNVTAINQNEFVVVGPAETRFVTSFIKPLKSEAPILPNDSFQGFSSATGSPGSGMLTSSKKIRFVMIGKNLYLPILRIAAHINYPNGGWERYTINDGRYSVLNPNLRNELEAGETIVVQQLLVKMDKQP